MNLFTRTPEFQRWLDAYDADHAHPWTHRTHAVGIPLVVLSTMGFMNLLPGHGWIWGLRVGWTEVALSLLIAFYAHHDLRIALLGAPLGAALAVGSRLIAWPWHSGIFILAWGIQVFGHAVWEKNRPAFFTNLVQLLVGPAYFLAACLGIRSTPTG